MPNNQKLVLIVEDDTLILEALEEGLKRAAVDVLTAKDGEEGLKVALAKHPDLILLDLMMPKKDGHEMLEDLRKDKWGKDVPVTVLTNATDNLDIFKVTRQANTHYAIKSSMKLEDIVKTVEHRVKKS